MCSFEFICKTCKTKFLINGVRVIDVNHTIKFDRCKRQIFFFYDCSIQNPTAPHRTADMARAVKNGIILHIFISENKIIKNTMKTSGKRLPRRADLHCNPIVATHRVLYYYVKYDERSRAKALYLMSLNIRQCEIFMLYFYFITVSFNKFRCKGLTKPN